MYAVAYLVFKYGSLNTTLLTEMSAMQSFFNWSLPFVFGMALYCYRQHIKLRLIWLLPLVALAVWTYQKPYFFECFTLAWTYTIFYLGFATNGWVDKYNRIGDYSYGVYIYAFPVQEILAHLMTGIGPISMMFAAFPLVLAAAIFSWHCVEKPAMARRHRFAATIASSMHGLKAYWTDRRRRAV